MEKETEVLKFKDFAVITEEYHFNGFDSPKENYFIVPKDLDFLLPRLKGAKLPVLLYIIRHTWGYGKETDHISYSQFNYGITKKDGTIIDLGTGLDSESLRKALKELEEWGVIKVKKIQGKTSEYSLNMKKSYPQPLRKPKRTTLKTEEDYPQNRRDNIRSSIVDIQYSAKRLKFPEEERKVEWKKWQEGKSKLTPYTSEGRIFKNYGRARVQTERGEVDFVGTWEDIIWETS